MFDLYNKELDSKFEFRSIRADEAPEAAEIEKICFSPEEACSRIHMEERASGAPETFLVAVDKVDGKIAGFLNGLATDEDAFRDEFFVDAGLHRPQGKNILILGLDVLPEYRNQGLATALMEHYKKREKSRGRQQLILTCSNEKVKMYEKMGYTDLGISASVWAGETWHEMSCTL